MRSGLTKLAAIIEHRLGRDRSGNDDILVFLLHVITHLCECMNAFCIVQIFINIKI